MSSGDSPRTAERRLPRVARSGAVIAIDYKWVATKKGKGVRYH